LRPKKACAAGERVVGGGWYGTRGVAWRRYIDIGGVAAQERKRVGVLVLHRLRHVDDHNVAAVVAAGGSEGRGGQDINKMAGG
jgi:hypothetical protein